ncbi:MerR family transcriptional regulator [Amycolatopsis sp. NBC_00345]|uniref:MerR family transcriptional regulator n=1 Tax=Amycolatopsis sp. NBC_00345 TaxID=2975955 RepID=UPI002E263376
MGWSTSQLAALADTSVRAVRHYHEIGLLPEPERLPNNYKSYSVSHLVRLLRIKRLIELGLSLPQIAELGDADEHPEEALRTLDAELAETIERLQHVRVELALILRQSAPTDLPPALGRAMAGADVPATDRSFAVVLTRVLGPTALDTYTELLQSYERIPAVTEFENLPSDAEEETRRDLAERLGPHVRQLLVDAPALKDLFVGAPHGASFAEDAIGKAVNDLYNPAQIDVLTRISR